MTFNELEISNHLFNSSSIAYQAMFIWVFALDYAYSLYLHHNGPYP